MSGEFKPLFGGMTYEREVVPATIDALEQVLEAAKSGEIVGVAITTLDHKGMGGYAIAGRVGGYSMIGAIEMIKAELVTVNWGDDE